VVVCPGVNDGPILEDTLAGILDRYPELASVACVPLGVSRFNVESGMRTHTWAEANLVVETVETWQDVFAGVIGRRLVYAADEYYLLTGRPFPLLDTYGTVAQHDNGVGMVRAFQARFEGRQDAPAGGPGGFFQSVDGAPAAGYRAVRHPGQLTIGPHPDAPITVLTGTYGAEVIRPLLAAASPDAEVLAVPNRFFGGNIGVAGLLTGEDVSGVLAGAQADRRYLLPDVCLSGGRFLDGLGLEDLPRSVEVVPADGAALRAVLRPRAASS
jgi:NifB/MoaA-like Fe-S oxidoreductase